MIWTEVPIAALIVDAGWRYDDPVTALRLRRSVRRYGQLRPVVVRGRQVVDGRRLVAALSDEGHMSVHVVDVGDLADSEAVRLALALEIGFEVDYARLARAVADLIAAGASADDLSNETPFTADRIGYFVRLCHFDWSVFEKSDSQSVMTWDGDGGPTDDAGLVPAGSVPDVSAAPAVTAAVQQMGLF